MHEQIFNFLNTSTWRNSYFFDAGEGYELQYLLIIKKKKNDKSIESKINSKSCTAWKDLKMFENRITSRGF